MPPAYDVDPYQVLGVRPFINCCGTRSVQGGSLILPQVLRAMAAAARQFVNIDELMERAGRRIAGLTGAESGIVTAGSAAAIAVATAAALTLGDPARIGLLPDGQGPRRGVVKLKAHRIAYDQAIRMAGAQIVEIEGEADLAALDPGGLAMIAYVGSRESLSTVPLETLVAYGRRHAIPVLVDAAPLPLRRPDAWLSRGADLVVYSGGKLLRGPQPSGLLIGKKRLIDAAWANASPHHGIGRPMKVGKEEIIGLLVALEAWFDRDTGAECQGWQDDIAALSDAIAGLPGVTLRCVGPDEGEDAPVVELNWQGGPHGADLCRRLQLNTPRVMVDAGSAQQGAVRLEVVSLQPGQARILGQCLVDAFRQEGRV